MNRIYLLIITLFMILASCSNSNDDVEQGENGNTNKESIVALWQDSDKEPENVVSFAKDGTYKIILKKSALPIVISSVQEDIQSKKEKSPAKITLSKVHPRSTLLVLIQTELFDLKALYSKK